MTFSKIPNPGLPGAYLVASDVRTVILVAHRVSDASFRTGDRYADLMTLPDGGRRSRYGGFERSLLVGIPIRDDPIVKDAPLVVLRDDRVFCQTHF